MSRRPFPFNERAGSSRGAPMGRPWVGEGHGRYVKVRHRQVRLSQGYDGGGAYWGDRPKGVMLFCLWTPDRSYVRFVDAPYALAAQEKVRKELPQADFL